MLLFTATRLHPPCTDNCVYLLVNACTDPGLCIIRRYQVPGSSGSESILRGHLAIVETKAQNSAVQDVSARQDVWLAGSDEDGASTEGVWRWYAGHTRAFFGPGVPEVYTNWGPGEPNSYAGHEEDCLMLYSSGGTWNDQSCEFQLAFVVEYSAPVVLASAGRHYEFVTSMLDWAQAARLADSSSLGNQPGAVLSIRSPADEANVRTLISQAKVFDPAQQHSTWSAGRYSAEEGNWQWMDGNGAGTILSGEGMEAATFTHWAPQQPQLLAGSDDACVQVSSGALVWSATQCGRQLQVVVQYEPPVADLILDLDAASYNGRGAWQDLSGNANHAVLVGSPAYDERRGAFRFGTLGVFAQTKPVQFSAYTEMTVEVYFWSSTSASRPGWLVSLGLDPGMPSVFTGDASTGGITAGMGDADYESGLGEPSLGHWHHVVAVFRHGQQLASFVALDGEIGRMTTASNKVQEAALPLYIGGNAQQTGIDGFIQVVRVYKHAFSAGEVIGAFERFAQRNDPEEVIPSTTRPGDGEAAVLANLRGDYDRHKPVDGRPAGHIPDESGAGTWDFYASAVPNGRDTTADLKPLTYQSSRVHQIIDGDAYASLSRLFVLPPPPYPHNRFALFFSFPLPSLPLPSPPPPPPLTQFWSLAHAAPANLLSHARLPLSMRRFIC